MPKKMTVESAQPDIIGETEVWRVLIRNAAGSDGVTHIFPKHTLDWRAAEYGIDPADVDTLLDVILHEPHMPEADGPDLWTADNTGHARVAHLARVEGCPVRIDVRAAKALAPVRTGHRPDAEQIRRMREQVDTTRWLKKYGDLPIAETPAGKKEADRA